MLTIREIIREKKMPFSELNLFDENGAPREEIIQRIAAMFPPGEPKKFNVNETEKIRSKIIKKIRGVLRCVASSKPRWF